jgi:hypothetical protein
MDAGPLLHIANKYQIKPLIQSIEQALISRFVVLKFGYPKLQADICGAWVLFVVSTIELGVNNSYRVSVSVNKNGISTFGDRVLGDFPNSVSEISRHH